MLKDILQTTNKMIEALRQENDFLIKGQYKEAWNFATKKEKIFQSYQEMLVRFKDGPTFLNDLTLSQKRNLREKLNLCKELTLENKRLLQQALRANALFLNYLMKNLNIGHEKVLVYQSNGYASDKDHVRALALSIDDQY